MRFGSLFTGIGGLDLGLERAGMECAWQVENNPFCIKVLEKHWPNTRRYKDVKQTHGLMAHASSEWPQTTIRKTGQERENTQVSHPESGGRGSRREAVFATSERAECPQCLSAVDLLAGGFPCPPFSVTGKRRGREDHRNLWPEYLRIIKETKPRYIITENVLGIVSTYLDTVLSDLESEAYTCWAFNLPACAFDAPHRRDRIFIIAHTAEQRRNYRGSPKQYRRDGTGFWLPEPDVGRMAHGIPNRIHRLTGLGNAVVPQVAEWIGQRIIQYNEQ